MNHLLNITKKELKELLTPGTVVSILVVVVLFAALGTAMSGESESMSSPKHMGIVYDGDLNNDVVISYDTGSGTVDLTVGALIASAYYVTYEVQDYAEYIHVMGSHYGDAGAIAKEMEDNGYSFVISVPSEFIDNFENGRTTTVSAYYSYSNGGILGTVTSTSGTLIVNNMSDILTYALSTKQTDPTTAAFTLSPLDIGSHTSINGKVYDDITPYQIYSAMMGQNIIVPIVVMIVIMMVGSVVISSMGGEKENKTLETLLTMPIKRTTIVSGKILAAAIIGLVYGICYLAGMMVYSNGLTSGLTGSSVNLADYGLAMDAGDWGILMVVLFLAIFSALGLCMILGAFTKNYKMAQTMTLPISGLALIPMFVFMFTSWDNLPLAGQVLMFAIPFSHPMMAMDNLIFGNLDLVLGGIAYLVVFDIITILITVRIYNSDILITGIGQSATMVKLKKAFGIKEKEHGDS